jgi:hypothetical protein
MPNGIRVCVNTERQQLNSVNTRRNNAADSDLWLIGPTPLTQNTGRVEAISRFGG